MTKRKKMITYTTLPEMKPDPRLFNDLPGFNMTDAILVGIALIVILALIAKVLNIL